MNVYQWCNECQCETWHEEYYEDGDYKERCKKCGVVNQ